MLAQQGQGSDVGGGDGRAFGGADPEEAEDCLAEADEDPGHRAESVRQAPDGGGGDHPVLLGSTGGEGLRGHLADHQHQDRDEHGGDDGADRLTGQVDGDGGCHRGGEDVHEVVGDQDRADRPFEIIGEQSQPPPSLPCRLELVDTLSGHRGQRRLASGQEAGREQTHGEQTEKDEPGGLGHARSPRRPTAGRRRLRPTPASPPGPEQ